MTPAAVVSRCHMFVNAPGVYGSRSAQQVVHHVRDHA
jgi:hypothetical protein